MVKKSKKKGLSKEDKQIIGVLITIALVFSLFLGTYFYVQSLKTFKFAGVEWVKEDYNGLEIYHSRFPLIYKGEIKHYYNMFLRNDPRENEIPTNFSFNTYPELIVSVSPEAGKCSSMGRVVSDLTMFMNALPVTKNISGAVSNQSVAEELNLRFANCTSEKQKTIILIEKSEKPFIEQEGDCYKIKVGECENVMAIEKFIVEIVNQLNYEGA